MSLYQSIPWPALLLGLIHLGTDAIWILKCRLHVLGVGGWEGGWGQTRCSIVRELTCRSRRWWRWGGGGGERAGEGERGVAEGGMSGRG